ncbi:MAG: sugar phosphate isomerase/epimerase [Chloroflexi bacterium]|nr:sugar phosphate isomerase/epimerase [Chloroflexota bacterium]
MSQHSATIMRQPGTTPATLTADGRPDATTGSTDAARPGRPPLGFSTLACPEWSPVEVVREARAMGAQVLEWRGGEDGHAGPHMSAAQRRDVRSAMDDAGIRAISVTTYTDVVHADPAVRAASVVDLERHAEVAAVLGAPVLRAFLGERSDDAPESALLDRAAASLEEAARRLAGSGVSIAIEPHDDFLASSIIAGLLERIGESRVDGSGIGVIWDAGNTWSIDEPPEAGLGLLAPWLRYVQVKDGTGMHADWRLTIVGEGAVPLGRMAAWLVRHAPDMPVSIEWERPWHPELPPASVALPAGLAHLRRLFDAAVSDTVAAEAAPSIESPGA